MIQIDGKEIKTPSSFKVTVSDVNAYAERNARGELVRDVVAVKRQLDIGYQYLTQAEAKVLLDMIAPPFIRVIYPDPIGGTVEKQFYVSDRGLNMVSFADQNAKWTELSFSLTEK